MTDKPNFIFYVSDSLRADHLSCYGYGRKTSPHIDCLSRDGIRFERAFAQAYKTVESSVSILTGLYPPAHQARTTYDIVPDEAPRIACRFADHGYTTAGFSSLVQISKRRGFDEGFHTFEELFRTQEATDGFTDWAGVCTDQAINWIEECDGGPFFLFVWSNGTHDPYGPRADVFAEDDPDHPIDGSLESLRSADPDQASRVRNLYDDTIRHADAHFGRLLDYLERSGLYDETVIVFTADHGELLSEHGRLEHTYAPIRRGMQALAPRFIHSQTLFEPGAFVGHLATLPYDELLHVPAIVKPDGRTYDGDTRTGLVETVDLMPTVADLAGIPFETQGESLQPLFEYDRPFKDHVFSHTDISRGLTNTQSVRSMDHKLVRVNWELSRLRSRETLDLENTLLSVFKKSITKSELLFELPDENADVTSHLPEARDVLRKALNKWIENVREVSIDPETSELDAVTKQQLRELGYRK
ncbi:sulfatase [Natronococcus pandeyae]|uniref:Sulfatase n=1 Tax=Natronococcus pandeyae TaxID=2055836 RepID=A0A8J8Q0Z9_9EURY|nr:sulfatase [Natronococcus pandeyae]TYL36423.1 sulfatase [Natronococcus pandeyae]